MKKSIFTFFIFIVYISTLSSCATSRKGGCDCFGIIKKTIDKNKKITYNEEKSSYCFWLL
ncbi:MAG: hypothetical protein CMP56_00625 [Flavobacteriales bacterium]|jgi:hypothetical protein|nr:hypothetical protein [Flavobacteriales bacterium]